MVHAGTGHGTFRQAGGVVLPLEHRLVHVVQKLRGRGHVPVRIHVEHRLAVVAQGPGTRHVERNVSDEAAGAGMRAFRPLPGAAREGWGLLQPSAQTGNMPAAFSSGSSAFFRPAARAFSSSATVGAEFSRMSGTALRSPALPIMPAESFLWRQAAMPLAEASAMRGAHGHARFKAYRPRRAGSGRKRSGSHAFHGEHLPAAGEPKITSRLCHTFFLHDIFMMIRRKRYPTWITPP